MSKILLFAGFTMLVVVLAILGIITIFSASLVFTVIALAQIIFG